MTSIIPALAFFVALVALPDLSFAGDTPPEGGRAVLSHSIEAAIDTGKGELTGTDTIKVNIGVEELTLYVRARSTVDGVSSGGKKVRYRTGVDKAKGLGYARFKVPPGAAGPDGAGVTVRFSGVFDGTDKARENIRRGVAFVEDGIIGDDGVFLPSDAFWYPREEDESAIFTAVIRTPAGFTSISNGEWIERTRTDEGSTDTWRTSNALNGLDLIAGRYVVKEEPHNGILLYTFFFEEDPALSSTYLRKSGEYLDLYDQLFGPYPFRKFAVVENFLPTGYGMPSLTLLGSSVLRLPFIPDTSLGHEIAHSWWGNSVFIDYGAGNWAEALTSYTADYLYAKGKGPREAMEYRLDKLRLYRSYARDTGVTLERFSDSTATESRAVGYDKGMMVFNMLENLIGDEAFTEGLRAFYRDNAFRKASWTDMREAFEKESGESLGWFFDQWITRAGGPVLALKEARAEGPQPGAPSPDGAPWTVSFTVTQAPPAYTVDLPVVFTLEGGLHVTEVVTIEGETGEFTAELPGRPVSMEVDPGYEVFRLLSAVEVPPTLSGCLGDGSGVIVAPTTEKYRASAALLSRDFGLRVVDDADPRMEEYLKGGPVFFFGAPGENRAVGLVAEGASRYFMLLEDGFLIGDASYPYEVGSVAAAAKNPYNMEKEVCVFHSSGGPEEVLRSTGRMRYYTRESYVVFSSEGVAKGIFPGINALRRDF